MYQPPALLEINENEHYELVQYIRTFGVQSAEIHTSKLCDMVMVWESRMGLINYHEKRGNDSYFKIEFKFKPFGEELINQDFEIVIAEYRLSK